jgi:recombination protein RecR
MSTLDDLIKQFERFPGVGARQARRFAWHLMALPETDSQTISNLIAELPRSVTTCHSCYRFFTNRYNQGTTCDICSDPNRDRSKLLVVATDNDIPAIERSGVYTGLYFVLGGTVPLLSEPENKRLRANTLKETVQQRQTDQNLNEIILGFPVNPDGENTARFVRSKLDTLPDRTKIQVVELGRGLSTGSELEYADSDTIKHALLHRTERT